MKRLVFISLFFIIGNMAMAQCQLCHLNEAQAKRVVEYLTIKKEAVIYAGCANKDVARHIRIEEAKYRPVKDKRGYYEVFLKGEIIGTFSVNNQQVENYVREEPTMRFSSVVDIAYVHIRTGGFVNENTGRSVWDATCLGIHLGYDCDPCIDPFDYPYFERAD